MKKACVLEAPGGGEEHETRHGSAGILGPPNYQFSKTTPHHSPQTTAHRPQEQSLTPCAQQRGGGYKFMIRVKIPALLRF